MNDHYRRPKYDRQSIRLQTHDYSQPGYYFITICVQEFRTGLFGRVVDKTMELNRYGQIAADWISNLPSRYPNVLVGESVVMPNHVHLILRVLPEGIPVEEALRMTRYQMIQLRYTNPELYRKKRRVMTIPRVLGYYQMNSAKEINVTRGTLGTKVWQRDYWDVIIHRDRTLNAIRRYIRNNPQNWTQNLPPPQ